MTHTFQTTTPDGTEVEVTYTFHKGWAGDRTDPPEPASVEIQSVVPDVPAVVWDTLVEECFEDYAAVAADAAEWRADCRRDDYE